MSRGDEPTAELRTIVAERRTLTDASLDAEREGAGAESARSATRSQRIVDDFIERDRILADAKLRKQRDVADELRATARNATPALTWAATLERRVADEEKQAERATMDALVDQERNRSDAAVHDQRRDQRLVRSGMDARRNVTDEHLSTERQETDAGVSALDDAMAALAGSRAEQARRWNVLGAVTHDLRSPLAIIAINAQLVALETHEESTRTAAHDMSLAVARMERLLTDLLDVARIEAGTLQISGRRQDVGVLLGELRRWYEPLFAERSLRLTVTLPANEIVARFDHDRIVQVLSNLLGNALKFTPANGHVELHVEAKHECVEFVLSDDGPGIPPDALPRIFNRFWQIEQACRRGLGLGLYICRNIVEAHGGRIWAESVLGQGSTFRFSVPTVQAAPAGVRRAGEAAKAERGGPTPGYARAAAGQAALADERATACREESAPCEAANAGRFDVVAERARGVQVPI